MKPNNNNQLRGSRATPRYPKVYHGVEAAHKMGKRRRRDLEQMLLRRETRPFPPPLVRRHKGAYAACREQRAMPSNAPIVGVRRKTQDKRLVRTYALVVTAKDGVLKDIPSDKVSSTLLSRCWQLVLCTSLEFPIKVLK